MRLLHCVTNCSIVSQAGHLLLKAETGGGAEGGGGRSPRPNGWRGWNCANGSQCLWPELVHQICLSVTTVVREHHQTRPEAAVSFCSPPFTKPIACAAAQAGLGVSVCHTRHLVLGAGPVVTALGRCPLSLPKKRRMLKSGVYLELTGRGSREGVYMPLGTRLSAVLSCWLELTSGPGML